ncbi:VOC family protein [Arthrobacter sunyaminii]|uniref:VOC family protein n=1 Tax=Arthrobacter sunyaminii TaxID=2816859 RepID=A0A975PEF9_9MICC|nr:VOC family protein [Arthrobacter sunyaminii]MBO0908597.1 VOC family protein [Arthrobacter sunyaminii]QWQ35871.1 VOC family protein [Arthrobacter sunyaminii]
MSAHELDHVAFAVPAWGRAGTMLHRELGARFASGFTLPEFNPCQVALAEDMRLELLEPGSSSTSFIARFLSENAGNAAPHHITFKVQDISAAIAGAQAAGIEPILVNTEHPLWQEAFLHPKDTGLGFLTQMVQTSEALEDITAANEFTADCPWEEDPSSPARLPVVFGLVTDLQRAEHVLVNVLGARRQQLPEVPDGEPAASIFRWPEGADLILQESVPGAGDSGLKALGFTAADEPWAGPDSPGLLELLGAGSFYPELGIRISPLRIPAPARSG